MRSKTSSTKSNVKSGTVYVRSHFVRTCAVFFTFTSFSGFVLSKCLQPSLVVFHFLMARVSDGSDVPVSPLPATSSNIGSPLPDLTGIHASTTEEKSTKCSYKSKLPLPMQSVSRFENCVQTLFRQWPLTMQKSQNLNELLAASQPGLPPWKRMQLPPQAVPARQALGVYLDMVMAPQPLGSSGPMVRGLLTTTGVQDVDLIPYPVQRMNMHEVPLCFGVYLVRKVLFNDDASFSKPTEFIVKQVTCQADLCSKQEPNVRTLWPGTRMMVSLMQLIAHFAIPVPISLSASPNRLKIEKLEDVLRCLWEVFLRLFGEFVRKASRNLP